MMPHALRGEHLAASCIDARIAWRSALALSLASAAIAADALAPAASMYLARCAAASGFEMVASGIFWSEHLRAYPWTTACMLVLCAAAPTAPPRWSGRLRRAARRSALMLALMPLACVAAWAVSAGVPMSGQTSAFGVAMWLANAGLMRAAGGAIAALQRASVPGFARSRCRLARPAPMPLAHRAWTALIQWPRSN